MKKFFYAIVALLLLSGLGIFTLGYFIALRSELRQNAVRTSVAPKQGRYLPAGDCEIFVQEAGPADGPIVLFVGGTGAWSENWKAELSLAASLGFHAVAIDLPPFGYSTKPAGDDYTRRAQATRLVALLQQMGAINASVIGHSFGGSPVLTAAAMSPERISALLLVDPALGWESPEQTRATPPSPIVEKVLSHPWIRPVLAAVATHPRMQVFLLRRVLYRKETATPEKAEIFARQMNVQGKSQELSKWLLDFLTIPDADYVEQPAIFQKVSAQATVLWGEKDDITPLWQGEKLVKLLPRAKLVRIPDVGHVPQIEDPKAFHAELEKFLRSILSTRAP